MLESRKNLKPRVREMLAIGAAESPASNVFHEATQRFAFVDSGQAWTLLGSRKKLEARKMLAVGAAESPAPNARFVKPPFYSYLPFFDFITLLTSSCLSPSIISFK